MPIPWKWGLPALLPLICVSVPLVPRLQRRADYACTALHRPPAQDGVPQAHVRGIATSGSRPPRPPNLNC
jgi:hypothetical protein